MKNKLTMNRLSKFHFFNGWASSQLSDIYKKNLIFFPTNV